jgi:hypothetical protein
MLHGIRHPSLAAERIDTRGIRHPSLAAAHSDNCEIGKPITCVRCSTCVAAPRM